MTIFKKCGRGLVSVRAEVLTEVTLKNAVFWDMTPCGPYMNRCFAGMYRLHHQVTS
jgi:hypothetical protein